MSAEDRRAGPGAVALSFVTPVYGSPSSLEPLCERIAAVCRQLGLSHEVVMVDDRCPYGSWAVVERIAARDPAVLGLRLSRNFGQHAAIQAGLERARGEWIVVMDCDLQDRPEAVPELLAKAREGFEIVRARRAMRQDGLRRRLFSSLFYGLLSVLTGARQSAEVANFGVYHRKVVEVILGWPEHSKYFPAIVQWVGFRRADIEVAHAPRHEGRSSYSFRKLLSLATNVIVGFSDRPLKFVMFSGLVLALLSFAVSFAVLVLALHGTIDVEGWASIVLSLWFVAGVLIFTVGLTGLYVGRILTEVKGRPVFIVDSVVGQKAEGQAEEPA